MKTLKRIKEIENKEKCSHQCTHLRFLLRAVKVYREIAIRFADVGLGKLVDKEFERDMEESDKNVFSQSSRSAT